MSKNNKRKKQSTPETYMQITNPATEERYMLKVPFNYKEILESLVKDNESNDFHNSLDILQFFCEIYTAFDNEKRKEFEVLLNSKVAKTETVSDLVKLAYEMYKYYRLKGVDSVKKLGEFHILAAKQNNVDDWIANSSFDEASEIGAKIKKWEQGKFYKDSYIGVYHCFLDEFTDD